MKLPPKSSSPTSSTSSSIPPAQRSKSSTSRLSTRKQSAASTAREAKVRAQANDQRQKEQRTNTQTARHRARDAQATAHALLPRNAAKEGVRLRTQRPTSSEQNKDAAQTTSPAAPSKEPPAVKATSRATQATPIRTAPVKSASARAFEDGEQTSSGTPRSQMPGGRRASHAQRTATHDGHYVPPSQHAGLVPSHLRPQGVHSRTPNRLTSVRTGDKPRNNRRAPEATAGLTSGETDAVEASAPLDATLEENRHRPRER